VDEVAELLRAEVEELVEVDTAVGELAERALGLEGCEANMSAGVHLPSCFVFLLRLWCIPVHHSLPASSAFSYS
jgi:hypothetical protein